MSDVEHTQAPPAGEEIHLPGPSIIPLLNAAAVAMMLLGLTTFRTLLFAGAVLFVVTTFRWIQDTRRDIDELPLEHH